MCLYPCLPKWTFFTENDGGARVVTKNPAHGLGQTR